MRIGIDFHSAERDGSGNCTYIRNLVENLIKIDRKNEYFLYVVNIGHPYYEKFKNIDNVHLCPTLTNNPFVRIPLLGLKTILDQIDVLHVQYIAPPIYAGKLVVTIHDVSFLHFPKCFRKFELYRQKILIPINIKRSDKIITVSDYSKKDIINKYNIKEDKVVVTYNGVNPIFKHLDNSFEKKKVLEKYGIKKEFILFVGRVDARKNVPALIKAFLALKKEKNIPHQLVIVGKKDFLPNYIQKEIETSICNADIIFSGYLSEEDLLLFYNLASVFVYPSLYEGFGLPCLEAMACGCPVVSSNISSIPEIVGDAGLLVNPFSIDEIMNSIYKIISDSELRDKLRDKGLKQAVQFNWESTALRTLEFYKSVSRG